MRSRSPARARNARTFVIGAATIAALAVVLAVYVSRSRATSSELTFPALIDTASVGVDHDDFAGSAVCADCHAAQFAAWSAATHGRAGQAPPADLVRRRFDGTPIRFRDATVEPRMSGDTFEFVVRWAGRADRYEIAGVIGGAHLVGGGTQGFVWRHPDGTVRLLPFELSGDDNAWFCAAGRGKSGWLRITSDMSIADCNDWPPVRVLGSSPRFVSCQQCHGSQLELVSAAPSHQTRFTSLSINCESCHGPAKAHAESVRSNGEPETPPALATLTRDESVALCMRCHGVKVDVRNGYLPGAPLDDHYSLKLALLGSTETHADGRTRTFAYQQGHYYSDCYLNGSMTCVDCHEPHGQHYRDINGRRLNGRFDDAQCTSCHVSKAAQPEQHTRHAAASEGSRCVACHMPFVQQPAVGAQIRYTRSDHTISIPRAELDARLGIRNACQNCHDTWSTADVARATTRLWGELKPLRPIIATLVNDPGRAQLQEIILAADTMHGQAYFAALARHFAALDGIGEGLPRRVRNRLWQLTQSADDDVAAIALATLHVADGDQARTRARLVRALSTLGPREAAVRRRWVLALGHRADSYRSRMRSMEAKTLYRLALELSPTDPGVLLALARAELDSRNAAGAAEPLARLVDTEPGNALAWVHLGHARALAGDSAAALDAYLRAARANPFDPLAQFSLGNALVGRGRHAEAADAYRRATGLDPSMAPAQFNLARLLLLEGDAVRALGPLRAGLVFDPANAEARDVVRQIEAERR